MIDTNLVVGICLLLPVLGALLVLILGSRPNVRETATLLIGGLTFWHVWGLLHHLREGVRPRLELLEIVPGVQLAFEVEPLGLLFALVASFLWIVTTLYAIGYKRGPGSFSALRSRSLGQWVLHSVRTSSRFLHSMRS